MKNQTTPVFKLILIGDSKVGKTSFLNQLINQNSNKSLKKSYPPTIGVQYVTKYFRIKKNKQIKSQIWDTCKNFSNLAGAQQYRSITSSYYRKSQGAILIFDVTERSSFENIVKWLDSLRSNTSKNLAVVLVGNKIDLVDNGDKDRAISEQQITKFCQNNNLTYKQASALTGYNVERIFAQILEKIYDSNVNNDPQEYSDFVKNSFSNSEKTLTKKKTETIHLEDKNQDCKLCSKCC